MRKTSLILLGALTLLSCNNDDGNEKNEISITGTWKFKKEEIVSGKNLTEVLHVVNDECSKKNTFEFNTQNEYSATFHQISNNECVAKQINKRPYRYDNVNKKLYFDEDPLDIIELSEKTLIIGWFKEKDINNDGTYDYYKKHMYK